MLFAVQLLLHPHPAGKLLVVGGGAFGFSLFVLVSVSLSGVAGIANFTDVAETFKGIIQAFQQFAKEVRCVVC